MSDIVQQENTIEILAYVSAFVHHRVHHHLYNTYHASRLYIRNAW